MRLSLSETQLAMKHAQQNSQGIFACGTETLIIKKGPRSRYAQQAVGNVSMEVISCQDSYYRWPMERKMKEIDKRC